LVNLPNGLLMMSYETKFYFLPFNFFCVVTNFKIGPQGIHD